MSELDVKISTLEPMRMLSAYGFGKSPEGDAWDKLKEYGIREGIFTEGERPQTFGFNNPNPCEGSPNYGYEIWLPVTDDLQPGDDLRIVDFEGGLYAVAQFKGLNNIGDVWHQLVAWREGSKYKKGNHQWLEELLTWPDVPLEEYVFNLYLPISE